MATTNDRVVVVFTEVDSAFFPDFRKALGDRLQADDASDPNVLNGTCPASIGLLPESHETPATAACDVLMLHDQPANGLREDMKRCLQGRNEIWVALHRNSSSKDGHRREIQNAAGNARVVTHEYSRADDDPVCIALTDLLRSPDADAYGAALRRLCSIIERGVFVPLSALKHNITNLFLPLDMDLQRLGELGSDAEAQVAHLSSVLNSSSEAGGDAHFTAKVVKFHRLLVGRCGCLTNESGGAVDGQEYIFRYIARNVKSGASQKVGERWEKLMELAGLTGDLSNPSCDGEGALLEFMTHLDELAARLHQGEALEADEAAAVATFQIGDAVSFHDWLERLTDCMDEMREHAAPKSAE